MSQLAFDTLSYFEKLKGAGVSEPQAKVQVEVMRDIVNAYDQASRQNLATKGDIQDARNEIQVARKEIQDLRNEMTTEFNNVRNEMNAEFNNVRNEMNAQGQGLHKELSNTKHEILKWIVSSQLTLGAILIAIMAFMK